MEEGGRKQKGWERPVKITPLSREDVSFDFYNLIRSLQFISMSLYCVTLGKGLNLSGLFIIVVSQMAI